MVSVHVQKGIGMQKCAVFNEWTDRERAICQRLSNRFKSEVRALTYPKKRVLGVFYPHRVECSEVADDA